MKYRRLLEQILAKGKLQYSGKAPSLCLINQTITLNKEELTGMFNAYSVPKEKLEKELELYIKGEDRVSEYRKHGILWWDYVGEKMINSYPQHFSKLQDMLISINNSIKNNIEYNSRNWYLNLNTKGMPSNQHACLAGLQFAVLDGKIYITVYQRSADVNLGLPCDIYQIWQIAKLINLPLGNITFFLANVHIYQNNLKLTEEYIRTGVKPKYNLNV